MNLRGHKDSFTGTLKGALVGATALGGLAVNAADDGPRPDASGADSVVTRENRPRDGSWAIDRVRLLRKDIRGKGADFGNIAAVQSSARVVMFKLHSDDPAVIDRVDTYLRGLVMDGYSRIGFLIADGPNGADNSAEVYFAATDGKARYGISKVDADNSEMIIRRGIMQTYPPSWKTAPYAASGQRAEADLN